MILITQFLLSLALFLSILSNSHSAMMNPARVRVVSYNVLSSHLASTFQFPTLNPDHLRASKRLPCVLKKLDEEVKKNSVICLQEVSNDWAAEFHTYFANKSYHVVTGLYGKKFNGYMGVLIAFSLDTYQVQNVDISRLSDHRDSAWPKAPKQGIFMKTMNSIASSGRKSLEKIGMLSRPPIDHWNMSENRFNILLSVQLKDKKSDRSFYVSTYHMPCAFYAPMVMTIHTEMAAKHVQNISGDCPYILTGDWNIKPHDSSYNLLTTGTMDLGHPNWPTPKYGVEWFPTAKPMRSAYASFLKEEPDFTNFARVKYDEPFIDTLDYIFLSNQWKIESVKELPHRNDAGGPFPNLDVSEPSDHILIAADLKLD